jgi:hypothetical protein
LKNESVGCLELIAVGRLFVSTFVPSSSLRLSRGTTRMGRKLHKIRRLYGPSLPVKPAGYAAGDQDPIAGPCAEQAGKEFADENWRDDSRAHQASQPKRRHIGAMSAIVGEAFDVATAPAPRKRLNKQALSATTRLPSANWVAPVNDYFWTTFGDRWERFTRDGSEKVRGVGSAEVEAYLPTGSGVAIARDPALLSWTLLSAAELAIELKMPRGAVIRDAVPRFVGRRIGAFTVQASDIAGLDINHFIIAFGAGSSAKQIKERLRAASAWAKQAGPHPRLPTLRDRDERDLQDLERGANHLISRRRKAVVAVAAALRERRHLSGERSARSSTRTPRSLGKLALAGGRHEGPQHQTRVAWCWPAIAGRAFGRCARRSGKANSVEL